MAMDHLIKTDGFILTGNTQMKMKSVKYRLSAILVLFSTILFAQQESLFTTYRYNMNLVNPAYAGVDGETILSTTFRNQWTGIKDAPQTQAVSFGTTLGKNLGIGISMVYDKTFIEKQTLVGLDISYKVELSAFTNLYFGIKAGGNSYNVNTSGIETYIPQSDPALNSISQFNPNVGFGALLKNEKYYVSFSIPRILNTERVKTKDGYASAATDRPHFYLSSGYDFDFDTTTPLFLKPSFMLRYVNGAPLSLDINTMLQIDKYFEIGGTYRTNKTYAGIASLTISKLLTVGYAYEVTSNQELASVKNTNEFLLRFKF
jgi:type IX secretion system PorP/SprF family membrane protein